MGTRKKLKQVAERVDKIAKVINSSQANVMYSNGFILGAVSGGGGTTYTAGNGIKITNNVISVNTDSGIDGAILTGTTTVENATVSGDFTLQKGAKFTGGSGAALDIECETEFDGSSVSFTNNASLNVADNTTVTGLIKSLGNEAVSGDPYHFTYYYSMVPSATDIAVTAYTITLDNNKTLAQYTYNVPAATTTTAGLMTAQDKTDLNTNNAKHLYQHKLAMNPSGSYIAGSRTFTYHSGSYYLIWYDTNSAQATTPNENAYIKGFVDWSISGSSSYLTTFTNRYSNGEINILFPGDEYFSTYNTGVSVTFGTDTVTQIF